MESLIAGLHPDDVTDAQMQWLRRNRPSAIGAPEAQRRSAESK